MSRSGSGTVEHGHSLVRSRDSVDVVVARRETDTVMHTGPTDPYIVGAAPAG